jgi:hypothetical protein
LIEASLAEQARLGVPEINRSPLTRAEAEDLLRLPRNRRPDDQEFQELLRAAADRAAERYGPHAEQAWRAAVGFARNLGNERSDEALRMAYRLARGERISPQEMQRYMRIQDIDRESSLWRGGGSRALGGGYRAWQMENATGMGAGDPNPMFGAERPAIMQTVPVTPYAGDAFASTPRTRPYTGEAQAVEEPSEEDIMALRAHPEIADEFDRDFWPGAAATYLQGEPPRRARQR